MEISDGGKHSGTSSDHHFLSTFLASTSAGFHLVAVSTIENNYVIMLSGQPPILGILLIFLRP